MRSVRDSIIGYLVRAEQKIGDRGPQAAVLAWCDLAYTRFLLGLPAFDGSKDLAAFIALLARTRLAGTANSGGSPLNVHLTAYVLGTLNLANQDGLEAAARFVEAQEWQWHRLFDASTLVPKWPRKYAHHSWRVSHWIGGAPSILKSLWHLAPDLCRERSMPKICQALAAADMLIDEDTGLLRTYRSDVLQFAFRQIYRMRHDPDAGNVGGVVHLHWVNYAEGRLPYKGGAALFEGAAKLMQRTPFMEEQPYCLDFDIVQIVRTAAPHATELDNGVRTRATRYAADILSFLETRLDDGYALHKLPGALATVHECALICGHDEAPGLRTPPKDIIRDAFWL